MAAASGQSEKRDVVRSAIDAAIHQTASGTAASVTSLEQWYSANDHELSWSGGRYFAAAMAVLDEADSHGLDPSWYEATALKTRRRDTQASSARDADRIGQRAALDVRVTAALLALGRDVSTGRTSPSSLMRTWKRGRPAPDVVTTLARAREKGRMRGWLDEIAPRHPEYRQLREWLAIARRANPADARAAQVAQLAANLERWRWVADDLGDRHLIVNIPEFMLRARERDATVLAMRVVVGKPGGHETPIISGDIRSVVFNPYWNIPESILLAETLPAITKDRGFLERNGMEVVPISSSAPIDDDEVDWDAVSSGRVRVRQRPGAGNALGKIKFPFSNDQAIYLHDTPSTSLFARDVRAFSHGCVRVAEPEVLANYVLGGETAWTPERISRAMAGSSETHVRAPRTLPVHLVYFTVIAGPDGKPVYLNDIYGLDRRMKWDADEKAP